MLMIQERHSGRVLAAGTEHEHVREFEGNWYFDPQHVRMDALTVTERTYRCPYKGVCNWIDLVTEDGHYRNVAWVYPTPMEGYEFIQDWIGFSSGNTRALIAVRQQDEPAEV